MVKIQCTVMGSHHFVLVSYYFSILYCSTVNQQRKLHLSFFETMFLFLLAIYMIQYMHTSPYFITKYEDLTAFYNDLFTPSNHLQYYGDFEIFHEFYHLFTKEPNSLPIYEK